MEKNMSGGPSLGRPPAIEIRNLTQHYGVRPVLRDLSLTVNSGECVAVLGPNASGKTTLLATAGGMLHPQGGAVLVNGRERRSTVEEELAIRRECVYLPLDAWAPKAETVRTFWLAVGRLYGVEPEVAFERIEALAALFHLDDVIDSTCGSLSTGQGRKLQLGAALLPDVPTLILDEPFSGGLDPAGIRSLRKVLRHETRERGRTVLFSIPVPELLDDLADRIVVLDGGKIAVEGTPEELVERTGAPSLTAALGELAFGDADASTERYLAR